MGCFISVAWYRFLKKADLSKKDDSETAFGAFVVMLFVLVPCVFITIDGVSSATKCLKISVAPRVFLVEESAKLVRGR